MAGAFKYLALADTTISGRRLPNVPQPRIHPYTPPAVDSQLDPLRHVLDQLNSASLPERRVALCRNRLQQTQLVRDSMGGMVSLDREPYHRHRSR
jgi:hypothetical protein